MVSFDAIIFDCDGVLVDSEILGLEASTDYLSRFGFPWSKEDLVRLFTGVREDYFAEQLTRTYREIHGFDPQPDFFEGLIDTRRSRRHLLEPVPGARDALEEISIRKAVASSSRADYLLRKLEHTGLHDFFGTHIYSADLVAHGKPAPDIFLYTAEKLDMDPSRCLVVEDSAHGVRAGCAAGMTVCGFIGGGHCFEGHDERLLEAGAAWTSANFGDFLAQLSGEQTAKEA